MLKSIGIGVSNSNNANGDMESYFPVRAECQADVPKTRFKPKVCDSARNCFRAVFFCF